MTVFLLVGYFLLWSIQHFNPNVMTLTTHPPDYVREGETVRLLCYIPPRPEHREVILGVEGWTSSTRQLQGEVGEPWQELAVKARCGYGLAFCVVINVDGKTWKRLDAPFQVWGCPEGDGSRQ